MNIIVDYMYVCVIDKIVVKVLIVLILSMK